MSYSIDKGIKMKPYNYIIPAFVFFLFSPLIVSSSSQFENDDFSYEQGSNKGPLRWGSMKAEWRKCSVGRRQSPIDIGRVRIRRRMGDLRMNYRSAPAVFKNDTHIVELVWLGNAGRLKIKENEYNLVNVHWHSPSEHTFNGTRYDLELHLVHKSDRNKFAVVSRVYQFGKPDRFLNRVLPLVKGERAERRVNPKMIRFIGRRYYRYRGSLTVPPCKENIAWAVFQQVKTVSRQQVEALRNVLPRENRKNSRPTQPLNRRPVFLYDPPMRSVTT